MSIAIPSGSFQVGGTLLPNDPTYVERVADQELYDSLLAGDLCFVLNSRQTGKSSLKNRAIARLTAEDGFECFNLDLSGRQTEGIDIGSWYRQIARKLWRSAGLGDRAQFETWWVDGSRTPQERLEEMLTDEIAAKIQKPIALFVDEIDTVLDLDFDADDFFAFLRSIPEAEKVARSAYPISVALFGVASPQDLIQRGSRTSFNVGRAIDLRPLGLEQTAPRFEPLLLNADQPHDVLAEIFRWTAGQPFLTQRLCSLVQPEAISAGNEKEAVARIVSERILTNWETKDENVHLGTIASRLAPMEEGFGKTQPSSRSPSRRDLTGKLLDLYRDVLNKGSVKSTREPDQIALRLTGAVIERHGRLEVYNEVYQLIFNPEWVDARFANLRPYAANFQLWLGNRSDASVLPFGSALDDASAWLGDKDLPLDREFLAAARQQQREHEEERARRLEAAEAELVDTLRQRDKAEGEALKARRELETLEDESVREREAAQLRLEGTHEDRERARAEARKARDEANRAKADLLESERRAKELDDLAKDLDERAASRRRSAILATGAACVCASLAVGGFAVAVTQQGAATSEHVKEVESAARVRQLDVLQRQLTQQNTSLITEADRRNKLFAVSNTEYTHVRELLQSEQAIAAETRRQTQKQINAVHLQASAANLALRSTRILGRNAVARLFSTDAATIAVGRPDQNLLAAKLLRRSAELLDGTDDRANADATWKTLAARLRTIPRGVLPRLEGRSKDPWLTAGVKSLFSGNNVRQVSDDFARILTLDQETLNLRTAAARPGVPLAFSYRIGTTYLWTADAALDRIALAPNLEFDFSQVSSELGVGVPSPSEEVHGPAARETENMDQSGDPPKKPSSPVYLWTYETKTLFTLRDVTNVTDADEVRLTPDGKKLWHARLELPLAGHAGELPSLLLTQWDITNLGHIVSKTKKLTWPWLELSNMLRTSAAAPDGQQIVIATDDHVAVCSLDGTAKKVPDGLNQPTLYFDGVHLALQNARTDIYGLAGGSWQRDESIPLSGAVAFGRDFFVESSGSNGTATAFDFEPLGASLETPAPPKVSSGARAEDLLRPRRSMILNIGSKILALRITDDRSGVRVLDEVGTFTVPEVSQPTVLLQSRKQILDYYRALGLGPLVRSDLATVFPTDAFAYDIVAKLPATDADIADMSKKKSSSRAK